MNIEINLHWTLVEYWEEKDLHRTLEDHESVLDVYYRTMQHADMSKIIYIYRQKVFQYEFFIDPTNIFKNVNFVIEDKRFDLVSLDRILSHMYEADLLPPVFGRVAIRQNGRWYKVFLLLRNGILYMTKHARNMKMWILNCDEKIMLRRFLGPREVTEEDLAGFNEIGPISFFDIYSGNQTRIRPTKPLYAFFENKSEKSTIFVLRPSLCRNVKSSKRSIYRFSGLSIFQRQAWVSVMRLAKYGKILRDNYRAYKEKHSEVSCSPRQYAANELPRANGEDAVMALVVFHRPGRSPDSLSTPDAPDWAGPILSKRAKRLKAKQRALQGLEPEEEESTLTKCLVPLMASLRFLDNSSPERVPMRGVEVNLEMVPMRGVEVNLQMPPAAIRDQPRPPLESIDDQPGPSSRRRINYDQPGTSSQFMDSQPGPSSRGRIHNDQPGTSYQMMDSQPGPSSLRRIDYDKPGTSSEMMDTQPGPSSLGRIDYDKPGTSSQLMDIQPGPSSQEHIYDILRPSSKIIEIKPKKHLSRSARVHPTPSTSKIVDVRYRKGEKFGSMLQLLRSFDSPQSGSTQSDEEASHILVSPDSSILERSLNEEESDYAMVGPRREAYGNFQGKGPRIKKSGKK